MAVGGWVLASQCIFMVRTIVPRIDSAFASYEQQGGAGDLNYPESPEVPKGLADNIVGPV